MTFKCDFTNYYSFLSIDKECEAVHQACRKRCLWVLACVLKKGWGPLMSENSDWKKYIITVAQWSIYSEYCRQITIALSVMTNQHNLLK